MAELVFKDLGFSDNGNKIRVFFLRYFYFDIGKNDLEKIAPFKVNKNSITFNMSEMHGISEHAQEPQVLDKISAEKARNSFNELLAAGLDNLKSSITGKKAIYIHKNSWIPLIGNIAFGLIDRDTSLIELKPITGCNLDCIFCSVDQSKRIVDFVVEKDYIVEEFKRLVDFKQCNAIEAHINAHGEPLMYEPLAALIADLKAIKQVKVISMDTNGTLLDKKKVDELVDAGLTRFNMSVNAISPEKAKELANKPYSIEKIKEMCSYIKKSNAALILSPVWVPGVNDSEMPKLIEFGKELGVPVCIQNFLKYRFGKKPSKQESWEKFFKVLGDYEKKLGVKLKIELEKDFKILKTRQLPKPFRKDDVIEAEVVCEGRFPNEMIAAAGNRSISIANCSANVKVGSKTRIKITGDKHNIFYGRVL